MRVGAPPTYSHNSHRSLANGGAWAIMVVAFIVESPLFRWVAFYSFARVHHARRTGMSLVKSESVWLACRWCTACAATSARCSPGGVQGPCRRTILTAARCLPTAALPPIFATWNFPTHCASGEIRSQAAEGSSGADPGFGIPCAQYDSSDRRPRGADEIELDPASSVRAARTSLAPDRRAAPRLAVLIGTGTPRHFTREQVYSATTPAPTARYCW